MSCKICIIGAGSAVFSLNLIKDICVNSRFKGSTVSLMDINIERLEAIYGLCKRYADEMNLDINIIKTTDRCEAMQGADFVLNVALDYGHERFKQGIKTAYDNGYRFGGSLHVLHDEAFFINFHQLKLMEEILVDMLKICPKAYYIMVANPVQGGVTYLSRKYKDAKIIGMCHGYTGVYKLIEAMGLERSKLGFEIAGVNHFIWLTSFRYNGKDGYKLLNDWLDSHNGLLVPDKDEFEKFGLAADEIGAKAIDLYKKYLNKNASDKNMERGVGNTIPTAKRRKNTKATRLNGMSVTLKAVTNRLQILNVLLRIRALKYPTYFHRLRRTSL